uniref:DDE Tnp4 domain-containing protein n=1 Tax=Magallana gigas TaxID=29159 RepID=K1PEI0_MAGGI
MAAILFTLAREKSLRRQRVFRDRTNPLDVFCDQELICRYRFPRRTIVDFIQQVDRRLSRPTNRSHPLPVSSMEVANFPNVVGAIDGTLIPIMGMTGDDEHVFVCRKGFHAVNMQGIVTADLRCLHKTGGALAYTPSKCVRIVECCCRLHNRAIEDRIPAPATGQVPIFSDNDTFNA